MLKRIATLVALLVMLLAAVPAAAQGTTTIRMLHFSDYHSHAVPFYSEGQPDQAGIARLIAYLGQYADAPDTLIFSGGDMINLGTPAWSDKYRCAEWPWFNGIVDAMAYGNHDADYGSDVFAQCRSQISYPILGSNVLDAAGQPVFQENGKTYRVFTLGNLRIGVFAVAGPDFDRLVRAELRPAAEATFADRVATAQAVVDELRNVEQVHAVVLIGHALYEDDIALAQAVPGIDMIFGTHSHRKEELMRIPNTNTYFISPFQYGTYISSVELEFSGGVLIRIKGNLVRMGSDMPSDPKVGEMVTQMQADLEADPAFAPLFQPIGEAAMELSTDNQFRGESPLGNLVMDITRDTVGAHLALATASGFRASIAPGTIREEDFRTAIPYRNRVLLYTMTGAQIEELLNYSVSRAGSDFFSQVSGARFVIADGKVHNIYLPADPTNPAMGYLPMRPEQSYLVATTDFQGKIAGGYKDLFAKAGTPVDAGINDIRDLVRDYIAHMSPVSAGLDGRITVLP